VTLDLIVSPQVFFSCALLHRLSVFKSGIVLLDSIFRYSERGLMLTVSQSRPMAQQ